MGRKKISTSLDESLVRRAKLEALRQQKQLNELIGEALEKYLTERGGPENEASVVRSTFGAIPMSARQVAKMLREEDDWLGA